MEFRKMVMMTLYQGSERDTDVKNSLLDSVGEGEGGMIWENGTETCILSCIFLKLFCQDFHIKIIIGNIENQTT